LARRRVVITGLGILSPVGNSVETAWQNIIAGRSGIDRITRFDVSSFPVQIAGEVRDFDIGQYLSVKEARRMDVFIHYGMAAGIQAIRDAGLEAQPAQAERVGVSIGSGIGGLPMIEGTCDDFAAGGVRKVSPFFVPGSIINMISGNLSIMYGYKGPNISLVSACSTGTHSIGDAGRLIEYGDADVMIAGGAEGCLSKLGLGGFALHAPCPRATTIPRLPAVRGTGTVTASFSVKARASWCWKNTSTPRHAVPEFIASWRASA
jgi:3-oxoacyl-[acyl-carrier-protein] synthase II (EC 2.3.1.41)